MVLVKPYEFKIYILGTKIKITKNGFIKVKSQVLKENPMLDLTIAQYNNVKNTKIATIATPKNKLCFNKWAENLSPYNMFNNMSHG